MDALQSLVDSFLSPAGEPIALAGAYFGAGLASSLLPCYYPLIPVTVGFLRRRGEGPGGVGSPLWLHPLFYWAGTIFLYVLFGIVAAFGGRALSRIMQNGWVVLLFGIGFLYLSLAMIDMVDLGFDRARKLVDRASSHRGLPFTFLMGMAAGLAASACVSPALVAILLLIAKQASTGSNLIFAGSLAFFYGAGLGLPLFVVGVLGSKLPASGRWMNPVKYTFAALVYVAAFMQMEKGFVVLGVPPDHARLLLVYFTVFALLLIFAVPYFFRRGIADGRVDLLRLRRIQVIAVSLLLVLFSLPFLVVRTGRPADDAAWRGKTETVGPITFYRNPAEAFAAAEKGGRPIFIDFYADWCANCKDFSRMIETDRELSDGLSRAVLLKVYDTDASFETFAKRFEELNIGLPFFAVLNSDGSLRFKTSNYRDRQGMLRAIQDAR